MFWHEYAKIPRVACKNPIAKGDFHWIFARNCEGTEQLRTEAVSAVISFFIQKNLLLLFHFHLAVLAVFDLLFDIRDEGIKTLLALVAFETASHRYDAVLFLFGADYQHIRDLLQSLPHGSCSRSSRTLVSISARIPASSSSVMNLLGIIPCIYRRSAVLLTCTGASQVGNAPAKCSIRIPMKRSMEPNTTRWIMIGRCFSPSAPMYSQVKSLRQLEVKLDGTALPGSSDRIFQMEVDLRSIECAVALVYYIIRKPKLIQSTPQSRRLPSPSPRRFPWNLPDG